MFNSAIKTDEVKRATTLPLINLRNNVSLGGQKVFNVEKD